MYDSIIDQQLLKKKTQFYFIKGFYNLKSNVLLEQDYTFKLFN